MFVYLFFPESTSWYDCLFPYVYFLLDYRLCEVRDLNYLTYHCSSNIEPCPLASSMHLIAKYWILLIVINETWRPRPEMLQLYNKTLIMSNLPHKFVSVQVLHSRPRRANLGVLVWGGKSCDGNTNKKIHYDAE